MLIEIIFTLVIAFCITLMTIHYYIYHKENEFVVKKIDMSKQLNHQNIEKSMKEREIIYVQNFNTTKIDIEFLRKNIKIKNGLQIYAMGEKGKKYSMPLKEWYDIYKKKKHKMLYIYPDAKTLAYFNYEEEFKNNMKYLISNRFYYLVNAHARYTSQKIMNFYEHVDNFYKIIVPINGDADVRLVSPTRKSSLYLREIVDENKNKKRISKYRADVDINYKEYPKAKNLKYVTVSLKKNDLLMVPYNWSYSVVNYKGMYVTGVVENLCSSSWKYLGSVISSLS